MREEAYQFIQGDNSTPSTLGITREYMITVVQRVHKYIPMQLK